MIKCTVNTGGLIQGRGGGEVRFTGAIEAVAFRAGLTVEAALLPGLCPREAGASVSQKSHAGLSTAASFPQQLTGDSRGPAVGERGTLHS